MAKTFFFYDLETSGLNPREDRIMQFAGQRTDWGLNPIGEPVNLLIKLSDDTLPSPYAIMVTGITPQKTLESGMSEAEFCKYVVNEIFTPNTIAVGYNSIRFDDEFMRAIFWRNFFDAYEWQWKDFRSKWDLLDVIRLTRALRPDGINWPITSAGKATNRLELITKQNGISHEAAHDALSDVTALIDVTRLIREKQPQLYEFCLKMRDKKAVRDLINLETPKPFVYASGRYSGEFNKTTVAFPLAPSKNGNILVFDLRYNLKDLKASKDPAKSFFPIVKELNYGRCPAVAPLGVLGQNEAWKKIGLTPEIIEKNLKALLDDPSFAEQMREESENRPDFAPAVDPESDLYSGFLDDSDRTFCNAVRNADEKSLADFNPDFSDPRLPDLLLHYKARNYPSSLNAWEEQSWETYRAKRISRHSASFLKELDELTKANKNQYLLQELQLWYQSVQPY